MDTEPLGSRLIKGYFLTLGILIGGLCITGFVQKKKHQREEFEKFTDKSVSVGDLLANQPKSRQRLVVDQMFDRITKNFD